jgi:GTPase Era involved in 16S rRNA processing
MILEYLSSLDCPVVAAINKTDVPDLPPANKNEMLESLGNYIRKNLTKKKRERVVKIVRVSARTGEGVEKLLDELFGFHRKGKYYPTISTLPRRFLRVSEILRKSDKTVQAGSPHSLTRNINIGMNGEPGSESLWVRAFLVVKTSRRKGFLSDRREKIRAIRMAAKKEINCFSMSCNA